MLDLVVAAAPGELAWAAGQLRQGHYLGTAVDPRCRPLTYRIDLAPVPWRRERVGVLVFGRPESTRCYQGGLTYGSRADVAAGRAAYDRWEVLALARVWLDPRVQAGGAWCQPGVVPGFRDRRGVWHSRLATAAIAAALGRVGFDYLLAYPPCFPDEPYAIRAVLSYCDRRRHRGTIYRAAGWSLARVNASGIETWYTDQVAPLTPEQDQAVRRRSARDERAARVRARRFVATGQAGGFWAQRSTP